MRNDISILVVADAEGIRNYLQNLLSLKGFQTRTADGGEEALQMIAAGFKPSLVILDVMMPEMDGLETLRRIKALEPDLPVIMLSVVGKARTIVEAMNIGASDYINKPFEEFSLEEYEDQVRVNSSAAFALARAVAPAMKGKGYGKIVNFCSVTLNGRWDGYVPYVASKGAMLGLTKSLARELGPHGVRVNAVSPGAVVSEAEARVFADRLPAYNDWILENQSLKARIQPEDVAELVHFLVSPASDMISGQNIAVDGGW